MVLHLVTAWSAYKNIRIFSFCHTHTHMQTHTHTDAHIQALTDTHTHTHTDYKHMYYWWWVGGMRKKKRSVCRREEVWHKPLAWVSPLCISLWFDPDTLIFHWLVHITTPVNASAAWLCKWNWLCFVVCVCVCVRACVRACVCAGERGSQSKASGYWYGQ